MDSNSITLKATPGHVYMNASGEYSSIVFIGNADSADNWKLIPETEIENETESIDD